MSRETELDRRFRTAAHPDAPAGGGGPGYFRVDRTPGACGHAHAANSYTVTAGDLDRMLKAAVRALPMIPAEVRRKITPMLTLESLAAVMVVGGIWLGAQTTPLGWAADVVIAGIGVIAVGADLLPLGRDFASFVQASRAACTDADLDVAAGNFARIVTTVGTDAPMLFAGVAKGAAAARFGANIRKWATITEAIDLKVAPDMGALWSGMDWRDAMAVAYSGPNELITLESQLKELGLMSVYESDFGRDWNPAIRELWLNLSKKFASGLEGRVKVFVKGSISSEKKIMWDELEEITDVLERNPKVTFIEIRRVETNKVERVITRDQVYKAARSWQ